MDAPACLSISSLSGTDISSSTVQGELTWPEMLKSFVPEFLSLPKPENHTPPRRQISGATATVSTLDTVVGHPNTPDAVRKQTGFKASMVAQMGRLYSPMSAGNGGLSRGFPCLPSSDSMSAVSSPQM